MDHQQRLLVASAIEKLVSQEDTSFESAQIIIDAFKELKVTNSSVTIKGVKTGDSAEGLTEHGNVTLEHGEQMSTFERGVYKERVGKWIIKKNVTRENLHFWRKHTLLFIHHFLYQETGSEKYRRYFLEFNRNFQPVAFGYIGDPEPFLSIGNFSIYFQPPIVLLGETRLPKEGPILLYESDE